MVELCNFLAFTQLFLFNHHPLVIEYLLLLVRLVSVSCFAISCTKARKSDYSNYRGEEAQEKPPGLQGMGSLS